VKLLPNENCNRQPVVQEAGLQPHPRKFLFVENPGKIPENLGEIYENVRKIPEILGITT